MTSSGNRKSPAGYDGPVDIIRCAIDAAMAVDKRRYRRSLQVQRTDVGVGPPAAAPARPDDVRSRPGAEEMKLNTPEIVNSNDGSNYEDSLKIVQFNVDYPKFDEGYTPNISEDSRGAVFIDLPSLQQSHNGYNIENNTTTTTTTTTDIQAQPLITTQRYRRSTIVLNERLLPRDDARRRDASTDDDDGGGDRKLNQRQSSAVVTVRRHSSDAHDEYVTRRSQLSGLRSSLAGLMTSSSSSSSSHRGQRLVRGSFHTDDADSRVAQNSERSSRSVLSSLSQSSSPDTEQERRQPSVVSSTGRVQVTVQRHAPDCDLSVFSQQHHHHPDPFTVSRLHRQLSDVSSSFATAPSSGDTTDQLPQQQQQQLLAVRRASSMREGRRDSGLSDNLQRLVYQMYSRQVVDGAPKLRCCCSCAAGTGHHRRSDASRDFIEADFYSALEELHRHNHQHQHFYTENDLNTNYDNDNDYNDI